MSFEFKIDETLEHGVHRIARAEVDHILADLSGRRRVGRDKAVHESRKRLKKLRALLRLLRDALPAKFRRRENAAFRDAARSLSAARDAKVLVDAFDALLEHFGDHVPAGAFGAVRARLVARRRAALREQKALGVTALARALRQAKGRIVKQKLKGKDFGALRGGLKHIFSAGRKAYEVALWDREAGKLHEWRKRVKDLWHQVELLNPIWPEVLEQFGDKAHALADCLGEDHDLAVLRETLGDESDPVGSTEDAHTLLALIDARRRELQQAAMELGSRVYGEKPGAFVERMGNYWEAWRRGDVT